MFSKKGNRRDKISSSNTNPHAIAPPLVSPLQDRFSITDQALPSPVSATHATSESRSSNYGSARESSSTVSGSPFSSTGLDERPRSIVSLQAPTLPPIPRLANRYEQPESKRKSEFDFEWDSDRQEGYASGLLEGEHAMDNGSYGSRVPALQPGQGFEQSDRVRPVRPTISTTTSDRTLGPPSAVSPPRDSPRVDMDMQSSLFPGPPGKPPSHIPVNAPPGPAMSRYEVDARDRVYNQVPQRPPMSSTQSSPAITSPQSFHSAPTPTIGNGRSPLSPPSAASDNLRLRPQESKENTRRLVKAQKGGGSSYSGSTARESLHSSDSGTLAQSTVGTPFEETSPSFPLPQHVATRPKTIGTTSSVAGVQVPTHHSHGMRPGTPHTKSGDKRKTRLLNPMALLTRRRSAQDDNLTSAERVAQNAALAKQKSIAAQGVDRLPADFDPRIRGKTVHDFSAPRAKRNYGHNESEGLSSGDRHLQFTSSTSSMPVLQEPGAEYGQASTERPSYVQQRSTDSQGSRHSRQHVPMFIEHLDENPNSDKRSSSLHAENLENREFLQRVSHQSSPSTYSQEALVLPPFARKSQVLDPMQAGFWRDDESKRSSDPSSEKERNSNVYEASPVTTRSSGQIGSSPILDRFSQQYPNGSRDGIPSPVSPNSGGQASTRPTSDGSKVSNQRSAGEARPESGTIGAPPSYHGSQPSNTNPLHVRPAAATIAGEHPAERPSSPPSEPRSPASIVPSPPPASPSPNIATSTASPIASPTSPTRLVERRASAVGHAKRVSVGGPKHRVSNASRFSFQMGTGSAAEERALEEKHRKALARGDIAAARPEEEGEDDYFDEDAMDDMDEMEMREEDGSDGDDGFQPVRHEALQPQSLARENGNMLRPPTAGSLRPQESDQGSVYEEDEDDVPEMARAQGTQYGQTGPRPTEYLSRSLSVDDYLEGKRPSMQSAAQNDGTQRSGFYMQPAATAGGYNLPASSNSGPQQSHSSGPSGTSLQQQQATDSFPRDLSLINDSASKAQNPSKAFAGGWNDFNFDDGPDLSLESSRPTSAQAAPLSPSMDHFIARAKGQSGDWKELATRASRNFSPTSAQFNKDEWRQSNTSSAPYHGAVGQGITVRDPQKMNQNLQYADSPSEDGEGGDEMYFDDGGFDEDFNAGGRGDDDSMDESAFDDPTFLARHNGASGHLDHQRNASAMTYNSLGSDGPYPSFAIPNPAVARQRESRLLLEDLPLQGPVDARYVPQRNPSEDAKRLGLSKKVPPLPRTGSSDGFLEEQANLQAYHAALADAANRAHAEGRFYRTPSVSTTRSTSVYSNKLEVSEEVRPVSADDRSHYSRYSNDVGDSRGNSQAHNLNARQSTASMQMLGDNLNRSESIGTSTHSHANDSLDYSPPKMSFDFGFDRISFDQSNRNSTQYSIPNPTSTNITNPYPYPDSSSNAAPSDYPDYPDYNNAYTANEFDDTANDSDDDIIAAANSSALASDSDNFYGSEFNFYSQPRPNATNHHPANNAANHSANSSESSIGGYFGEAGDDGLQRQKSLREPNLTPITERSEFSTRNSLIALGGMPSAGLNGPMSPAIGRLPRSPLAQGGGDEGGFFGGRKFATAMPGQGYFGPAVWTQNQGGSSSGGTRQDSPASAASSGQGQGQGQGARGFGHSLAWGDTNSVDVTPRKGVPMAASAPETPQTARKVPPQQIQQAVAPVAVAAPAASSSSSHSRSGSGADSVTYVREREGNGQPRWVLERRRTSEFGLEEVVGREVVQGGWI